MQSQRLTVEPALLVWDEVQLENTIRKGLERAARHMDSCSAVSRHLVVFDSGPDKARGEPVVRRDAEPGAPPSPVWGK